MRKIARRDKNHSEIVKHLKRCGVDVIEMMLPLDLLCHYQRTGYTSWVEVKIEGSAAKYTGKQLRFIADTKFNVIIAKTGDEALKAIKDRKHLTSTTKDRIAALLAIEKKECFTPKEIEALLD